MVIASEPWLSQLASQLRAVRANASVEDVHHLRVAIARLRVWLSLGRWHALQDDLRWLRDRAAAVRDFDVQIEHGPPPRWASYLQQRREQARLQLVRRPRERPLREHRPRVERDAPGAARPCSGGAWRLHPTGARARTWAWGSVQEPAGPAPTAMRGPSCALWARMAPRGRRRDHRAAGGARRRVQSVRRSEGASSPWQGRFPYAAPWS